MTCFLFFLLLFGFLDGNSPEWPTLPYNHGAFFSLPPLLPPFPLVCHRLLSLTTSIFSLVVLNLTIWLRSEDSHSLLGSEEMASESVREGAASLRQNILVDPINADHRIFSSRQISLSQIGRPPPKTTGQRRRSPPLVSCSPHSSVYRLVGPIPISPNSKPTSLNTPPSPVMCVTRLGKFKKKRGGPVFGQLWLYKRDTREGKEGRASE